MSSPQSPALAAVGPEIASARPAPLPGDLVAAADLLTAIDARLAEAEGRDGLTRVKRRLVTRQRERLALLSAAARALEERNQAINDAVVAYVTLEEPLASSSLARRERMAKVVETGLPQTRTLRRLAHGDHVRNVYERALDLRELASLYGRYGSELTGVAGYELADEPLAFQEARAIFNLVNAELRDAERLADRAALWTLIEHGYAAAVGTLTYLNGDEPVDVPPL